ncbi:MAG TPA: hypothetical protein VIQ22_08160 [Gammaproteobacteria bacterium]
MSLMAVVSQALETEIDSISEEARLVEDLHMDRAAEAQLSALIEEVFDGLQVDLHNTPTVAALLDQVVMREFQGLPL